MANEAQLTEAASILMAARSASLAVLRPDGSPYVSLVMMAMDGNHCPTFLLSDLAEHSKCLAQNDAVSLLIDASQDKNGQSSLTGARLTILGNMQKIQDPVSAKEARQAYLSRHPDAAQFVDFADFHFYRLKMADLHLVAGFGKIDWISAQELPLPA